jgi:hypothetical protein
MTGDVVDELIRVETDLFEHREVKAHFINPCCFGEDFAAWLKQELLLHVDGAFDLSETIQEDYGWGFWAPRRGDRFWIALSYVGDGPQSESAQWIISVTYDPGFNLVKRLFHSHRREAREQLITRIKQVIGSNNAIKTIEVNEGLSMKDEGGVR